MASLRPFVPERDQEGCQNWTSIRSARDLGGSLRVARKALGLTQADLALAAGVGLRFVVELEAGKPTVRLGLVLRVIDALGGSLQLGDLTTPIDQGEASRGQ
ncbi:helix-turn-helix transcriptional regulator [Synechococcus sp. CCY9202]|uniref:helix-turn-helix transcriptional regulator n=1 Tax=Synechococcus sp. CCY9202 TaxID=174698 RepID=UPI002B20E1A0|nr:helix-turn-helix transcriptional regulator [Synechococcus sp. CCY9202]MEA5423749.1 helix-turn-helix transcriptional regulator [Synechococcus sp. CCY9202]